MPSSHIWLVNVWHLVSCLIGGVNRHIGWYIGWVSGECRLTYQLIYRPSIGGYIDQVSVQCWSTVDQVSMDVSVNRWSTVSHDSIGSNCVSVPSVEYRQCTCIGGVSVKHRHCLFNFFTDLFCSAFRTTSHQSYIRYCQQYQRTHVTKRSKLSYRYVIFGDRQTVKSTN